jgi:hypothetical protein
VQNEKGQMNGRSTKAIFEKRGKNEKLNNGI